MNPTIEDSPTAHVQLLVELLAQARASGMLDEEVREVLLRQSDSFRRALGEVRAVFSRGNAAPFLVDAADVSERLWSMGCCANAVSSLAGVVSNPNFLP